jgi:hypothetical protein
MDRDRRGGGEWGGEWRGMDKRPCNVGTFK